MIQNIVDMISEMNFKYTTIDTSINEYKELHNSLFFGASISKEWIKWYHKDIPRSTGLKTVTYAVYDKTKLVGVWSVEPKLLNINGKATKVGRCFAVGIHDKYRRLGLFVSLSKFAISSEIKRSEFDYIICFPQKGRSVIGGHLKAGWKIISEIPIYSANKFKNESHSISGVEIITDFNNLNYQNNLNGSFIESPLYRNNRWLKHPDYYYICLKHNNSYLILKIYSNFCHIIDFVGEKRDTILLLKTAKNLAFRHNWSEINLWCANNEYFKNEIIAAGFKEGANFGTSISLITVNINETKELKLDSCHIQMGVDETY
jgi:hypothetical protein